ncbi:TIGR03749 family integrating conjugative element protein [Motilimonas eburnea]|uniref:TIGR03749 family integrating conjugative element protein n=1 Tax=Motilimonas eburnea TaxID=1737488 RepID=UPI001E2F3D1A|nr:TIGR03749 family integrating conjugative element protein [Motilimonas eburnea]MCE2573847.1 TIGR03749 family integrating conjugative element protein [Motilimonas eburnea]
MKKILKIAAIAAAMATSFQALATEVVTWERKPIKLILKNDVERIVYFPDNVRVGMPPHLQDKLRVMSAEGAVYLKSSGDIKNERIQIQLIDSGQIVLMDVVSSSKAGKISQEDMKVSVTSSYVDSASEVTYEDVEPVTPIEITRYAAKQFYAPPRLRESDNRIQRTSVAKVNLPDLMMGRSHRLFYMTPVASWQANGNLYVTAIKVSNITYFKQNFLYSDINADYTHATFQHGYVTPKGQIGDTSMLYLVTNQPFEASLYTLPTVNKQPSKQAQKQSTGGTNNGFIK